MRSNILKIMQTERDMLKWVGYLFLCFCLGLVPGIPIIRLQKVSRYDQDSHTTSTHCPMFRSYMCLSDEKHIKILLASQE